jgi:hypothetical protein
MKKSLGIALCFALLATFAAGAAEFTPAQNVTFVVSSSPEFGTKYRNCGIINMCNIQQYFNS